MALIRTLRTNFNLNPLSLRYVATSSVVWPTATSTAEDKTRVALTLLKSESNPERILDICRSASFNPGSRLDRIALTVAVSKLSEANHAHAISQFIEELKSRPDLNSNESVICHSIVLYGRANMTEHAVQTFKEMDKQGLPQSVNAFNALLFAFILAKDYKQATRIFTEFPKTYGIEPNLDSYNRLIKSCCMSVDSSSVKSILSEMDRKSIRPNGTSLGLWLCGCYKDEKYEDVNEALAIMEKKYGIKAGVTIYNVRIKGLCKLRRSKEAKALLDEMITRGTDPNSASYNHLIHGYCKEGEFENAYKMFARMISRGLMPDGECYLKFLCQSGDYETSVKVFKECMEKSSWVPYFSTTKALVSGLAGVSKVAEARQLLGIVKEKFPESINAWNQIESGLPR